MYAIESTESSIIKSGSTLVSLSIVVPLYNGSQYIEELAFRINQVKIELNKFGIIIEELIFVCDDPLDQSYQTAISAKAKYNYIDVINLGSNVGQHFATSIGILNSSSELVCTLDEDLQHSPEMIFELLKNLTHSSSDLTYGLPNKDPHKWSFYRTFASKVSKSIVSFLTGVDITKISSFRLMRGELARLAATSMDSYQYLDVVLMRLISKSRISCESLSLVDIRKKGESGYTFKSLLKHFSKLLLSSDMSGKRTFLTALFPLLIAIIVFAIIFLLRAFKLGLYTISPGWASIFALEIIIVVLISTLFAYTIKMMGIISSRLLPSKQYLIIDRSKDQAIYQQLIEKQATIG